MRNLLAITFLLLGGARLTLADFNVTSSADSGAGSLRQAITDANAAGGGTINITSNGQVPLQITLQSPLPVLSTAITINGSNAFVSGNNQYRVFFVDAANSTVALHDLSIVNGNARGGTGAAGGGGGLGAGGGLFVSRGNVTLSDTSFQGNAATGGAGGSPQGKGGGGGLGGNGGSGGGGGGGGGYFGNGGNGGINDLSNSGGGGGFDTNGEDSSGTNGGRGGGQGGLGPAYGGGSNQFANSGAGGGSLASPGENGGAEAGGGGGRFGGGGGGADGGTGGDFGGGGGGIARGGNGGFGGGGGAGQTIGGFGGFGGGGGGSDVVLSYGNGGAFGGNGNAVFALAHDPTNNTGGGGAALGGNVFVRAGASLTFVDTSTDSGTVTPGAGGVGASSFADGAPGLATGQSLFLSGTTIFSVSVGKTRNIGGLIADVGDFINDPTAIGFEYAKLYKTGLGTLVLQASNAYRGGTLISQGTLVADVNASSALGSGLLTINDLNTGSADTTFLANANSISNPIVVVDAGTGNTTLASGAISTQPMIFNGTITLNKSVTIQALNSSTLSATDEPGQTRFDGTISGVGGVTITGAHMVQFRAGAKTYTGPTIVTGNSILSLYDDGSTPINSIVEIDAGSNVVLENLVGGTAAFAGLNGTGNLANNDARGHSSLQVGSSNANIINTFTGTISGSIGFTKMGTDTLRLGAQNNSQLDLAVANGRLQLLGDLRIADFAFDDSPAGTQAVDLAGHAIVYHPAGIELSSAEPRLNRQVGNSSDGLYDSTLLPNQDIGIAPTADGFTIKKTISGDTNLDGKVDFADLVVVAQHYGTNEGRWRFGDVTHDGKVDFADLVRVAQNYGDVLPSQDIPGAPADFQNDLAAAFAQVPEPAAMAPFAVLCLALFRRGRIRN